VSIRSEYWDKITDEGSERWGLPAGYRSGAPVWVWEAGGLLFTRNTAECELITVLNNLLKYIITNNNSEIYNYSNVICVLSHIIMP